jgi:hypothetical protein
MYYWAGFKLSNKLRSNYNAVQTVRLADKGFQSLIEWGPTGPQRIRYEMS